MGHPVTVTYKTIFNIGDTVFVGQSVVKFIEGSVELNKTIQQPDSLIGVITRVIPGSQINADNATPNFYDVKWFLSDGRPAGAEIQRVMGSQWQSHQLIYHCSALEREIILLVTV